MRPEYLGFYWDLCQRQIEIPEKKTTTYLKAIEEWEARDLHDLEQVRALLSRLMHASLVVIPGRARLTALEAMLARGASRPHCQHLAISPLHKQLRWWRTRLAHPVVSRPFRQFIPYTDFSAYSDASSRMGIGFVIGESWRPTDSRVRVANHWV